MTTTINARGRWLIREFLAANHKRGAIMTSEMIGAWANEAEESLEAGNPAMIEVRAMDSISGHPVTFTVPDEGVDYIGDYIIIDDGMLRYPVLGDEADEVRASMSADEYDEWSAGVARVGPAPGTPACIALCARLEREGAPVVHVARLGWEH